MFITVEQDEQISNTQKRIVLELRFNAIQQSAYFGKYSNVCNAVFTLPARHFANGYHLANRATKISFWRNI